MKKLFILVILMLAVSAQAFGAGRTELELKRELEEIQRRIEKERTRVAGAEKKKQGVLDQLERTDAELRVCERELKNLKDSQRRLRNEIALLEKEIASKQSALKQQETYLAERLRVRYRFGEIGTFKVIMSSHTLAELAKREKFLQILYAKDQEIMDEYRTRLAELEESREELLAREAELSALVKARAWVEARLIQDREQKRRLIEDLNQEKSLHLEMLAGLEESERRLSQKLNDLAKSGSARDSAFGLFKGHLCFPVPGVVEESFGEKENPRFHTVTFQKGIDLRARAGTPIESIYSGMVVFADWFRGYGNLMIIDHGAGFYSLYAHAERFTKKAGDEVSRGELIGTVGETGSIKGAYLYFELRHHGEPLDPEEWLDENCRTGIEN
jgi:septal ring factor EnvC (AmiA/AmiB activator)